jgi:hypothetical protein
MSVKYQLDGHRHCFSLICRARATEAPWEAVFVACNQQPADLDLLRDAILGMEKLPPSVVFTKTHFYHIDMPNGRPSPSTFRTANIKVAFGLKLGVRGILAYNIASRHLNLESALTVDVAFSFKYWAIEFVEGMKYVEKRALEVSPLVCGLIERILTKGS